MDNGGRGTILGTYNAQRRMPTEDVLTLELEVRKERMDVVAIQETHIKVITVLEEYIFLSLMVETCKYSVSFMIKSDVEWSITKSIILIYRLYDTHVNIVVTCEF